jgi:pyrrolidone-carboxylate peptidase
VSPGAALLRVLLLTLPVSATGAGPAADPEEDRLDRARATLPEVFAALAPVTLACPDTADAEPVALDAGRTLWRAAADGVRRGLAADGRADDRPLYWQRLAAQRAGRISCPAGRARFESASRGFADVRFDAGPALRVLVTGFDPFLLDRDLAQSNPSGVAALHLDGLRAEVGGRAVAIESVVVPVRFADFDAGLVERMLVPLALRAEVDLLVTLSMGRDAFDLERFPGRRRSAAAPDNRDVRTGGSAASPVLPRLGEEPLAGPEFVECTLPVAALQATPGPFEVRDNHTVTTLEDDTFEAEALTALAGRTAVRGSGGGYLSNEISYRVLNALRDRPGAPRSGHVHTPRIRGHDPETVATIVAQVEAMILAAAGALPREAP